MKLDRREFLQLGALAGLGLTLPRLLAAGESPAARAGSGRARSCILLFLEGGPSHLDTWDMKPAAPSEVRGEFQPIQTRTPGVVVCEHLPKFAEQIHRFAQIRAVHHKIVDHNAGSYYMLTGRSPAKSSGLIVKDEPDNFPPFGAVLSLLQPSAPLPSFVHLPDYMSNNGFDLPGQRAGVLGAATDPLVIGDPSAPGYRVPGLELPAGVDHDRLAVRRELLAAMSAGPAASDLASGASAARFETFRRRAYDLFGRPEVRDAFDVLREPTALREKYGLPDRTDRSVEARKFGGLPHLGQCCLMARRLVEAGVRLVTVCSGRRIDQAWDTHRDHFPLLKRSLLPYADQAFATLVADLADRGLLDETLVVMMGEFGRTPRLGQITSGAGADRAGRDHWPHCYTVLIAGGGVRAGLIHGASDAFGAYPLAHAATPEDVAATIYHALGVAPDVRFHDSFGRPHSVSTGEPIRELFG